MVIELQPFVVALIDHVGIKLSFGQHVERKEQHEMSIFSSIVSRSSWSRTCEWCEGPRWWKGRNLCLIVRTQFSVLHVHSLRRHVVALPQLKVFSSSSSLQLESNFHLSLVRLDLEVLCLVQIGKLHGLTNMHLRQ